ncbi:hypothetical protein [Actinomadura litoris]|uniref:hypothetical protein n=1 Tax=Actinomadura litoris TaxID=2678616 RepID=UPI001FA7D308|nr:hypothetical protein [Actinomadura litoris]
MWSTIPNLAVAITLLEAAVTTTIIATALYAPGHLSIRAFRLLPWGTPETSSHNPTKPAPPPAPNLLRSHQNQDGHHA